MLSFDSFMNQLGFSKIMKKYDKVTQRSASRAYLDMIDKSYLNTCDEVGQYSLLHNQEEERKKKRLIINFFFIGDEVNGESRSCIRKAFLKRKPQKRNERFEAEAAERKAHCYFLLG